MGLALDALYTLVAIATAPWWMRKARSDWGHRFGKIDPLSAPTSRPRLLLHAVSVGEVNLTRPLIDRLAPTTDIILSVTTDTGIARARALHADRIPIVRYPLDASWAVRRFLDAVNPDAVALTELELWPHFIEACNRRDIPVAVVNGRLSARSFKGYRKLRPFIARHFRSLTFAAVQDADYAERFQAMGVPRERIHTCGTMKWDAALSAPPPPEKSHDLRALLRIDPDKPLIVAGSTAPDEHALLHNATPPSVQLLCAPRRPEWFDQAARDLPGCIRRSAPDTGDPASERFLLDSIGDLDAAYALADLIVIGRSFTNLHGSDPMQPAALAKPIIIGPEHSDFADAVRLLSQSDAIEITTAADLPATIARLMADPQRREQLARNARACVDANTGATERHASLLTDLLNSAPRFTARTTTQ